MKVYVRIAKRTGGSELSEIDWELGPPVSVRLSSPTFGELLFSDGDLFGALARLRLRLEEDDYFLLCNASRIDAYPSKMAREIGAGRKIYIFRQGVQSKRDDLVDVFESATMEQVGTVAEQRSAYDDWIRSLGR